MDEKTPVEWPVTSIRQMKEAMLDLTLAPWKAATEWRQVEKWLDSGSREEEFTTNWSGPISHLCRDPIPQL